MKIQKVLAEEILDSRGNPTVAASVVLEDGSVGYAAVPSGASTGVYEAVELRDNDAHRYKGMGVLQAVEHVVKDLQVAVVGLDAKEQELIDQTMIAVDGTENKSRLGANAILAVSLATAKAQSVSEKKELFEYLTKFNTDFAGHYTMPVPEMNVLNGAKHANWATDIQEYMLFPIGASSFSDALRMNVEIYHQLKIILKKKGYAILLGDEGGFAPNVASNEEPFYLLVNAVEDAGYMVGKDIYFGIDAAASEFYQDGKYHLTKEQKHLTSDELLDWYKDLQEKFSLISFEDIFAQDDFEAFSKFTSEVGSTRQVVGDDLYATNIKRLQKGIDMHATNAILIKLNQIGTLTETIHAIQVAKSNNMEVIISHRSGETEDAFIADLAVAMGTGQIKAGAPARSERVVKYNRLLHIANLLGEKARLGEFPFIKN